MAESQARFAETRLPKFGSATELQPRKADLKAAKEQITLLERKIACVEAENKLLIRQKLRASFNGEELALSLFAKAIVFSRVFVFTVKYRPDNAERTSSFNKTASIDPPSS